MAVFFPLFALTDSATFDRPEINSNYISKYIQVIKRVKLDYQPGKDANYTVVLHLMERQKSQVNWSFDDLINNKLVCEFAVNQSVSHITYYIFIW